MMRLTPKVCEKQNQQPHRSCNFGTGVFGALYESAKQGAALEAHAPRTQGRGCKATAAQTPSQATSIRQCTSKSVSKGVHMFTATSTRRQFVAGAAGLAAVAAMGGVQLAKADQAASSIVDGTSPPYRSTSIRAAPTSERALLFGNVTLFIYSNTASRLAPARASGVG